MSALFDQIISVKLTHTQCGECQFHFAIDDRWNQKCLEDHGNGFYCPKCGVMLFYRGESEAQKLKRQLESKQRELTWEEERSKKLRTSLNQQKRKTTAQKGAKTRILNRVKAGVCPCCNRTFENLKWHMESKHPEMKPEEYLPKLG